MKIKHLIKLLQSAPDRESKVWIPSISHERTTNIDFNFDDFNNLDLYETGSDNSHTLSKIKELEKLKKA